MSSEQMKQPPHGPYRPTVWSLGGIATIPIDVPITAVFLFLFVVGAITHMTLYQRNIRRDHKFKFSIVLFGFCMARTVSCILRIASICLPDNINLNIAAMIFVAAGIILLYFVNLKFAQRVFRAQHPRSSWHPLFVYFINAIIALTIITIIMLIVAVVQSLFTLNPNIHRIDHDIQKYGSTCFAIISFLPFVLVILGLVIPRRSPFDRFGTGHFRSKIAVLLLGSALLCLGASFKAGTIWLNPVPQTRPLPWYLSRACFYIFNFTVEICVVYMYALLRVDQRFHVPDGAKGPGSYSATAQAKNKRMVSAMDTDVETGEKRETL